MLCTQPGISPRHQLFCQGMLSAILTFINYYNAVAKSAWAKRCTSRKTRQTLVYKTDMTCCATTGAASVQTSQALNSKNPPPQNCRAHDALRATSWGGHPSSPVPGPRKRPTPPLPPHKAVHSLMVTLPPETSMFSALMAPAHMWQLSQNPKQLPKP